jgi:hypothetical protein
MNAKFELEKVYRYTHTSLDEVWADVCIKKITDEAFYVCVVRTSVKTPNWSKLVKTQAITLWAYLDKDFDYSKYTLIDYDTKNIYDSLEEMLYEV